MNMEDFEKQLQQLPMRPVPAEWREQIMDAARPVLDQQPTSRWRELLWPCPQAWAGLATVWVVILVLNMVAHEPVQVAKAAHVSPPQEVLMALREQRRLFVELVGPFPPAKQSETFIPRPRSEISHRTVAV